jgi:hypothetical protein
MGGNAELLGFFLNRHRLRRLRRSLPRYTLRHPSLGGGKRLLQHIHRDPEACTHCMLEPIYEDLWIVYRDLVFGVADLGPVMLQSSLPLDLPYILAANYE